MTLEQLHQIITDHFGEPFLKAGHVEAKFVTTKEKTLQLRIGPRDVWINEAGEITGAGTDLTGAYSRG